MRAGNGWQRVFDDGSRVQLRPVSSKKDPAVDIVIKGPGGDNYKIHFEGNS